MRHVAGASGAPVASYDADVVILSLDRPEETAAAIRSALTQTGVSRHVFVVDQGSRPENLACLAGTVASRGDVTLVALDANFGVAGGRNRGTALGVYLCFTTFFRQNKSCIMHCTAVISFPCI